MPASRSLHPAWLVALGIGVLVFLSLFMGKGERIEEGQASQVAKGQVVASMRVALLAGLKAEKDALLAATPEEASSHVAEAKAASVRVDDGLARLKAISQADGIGRQQEALAAFEKAWAEAKAIDGQLWGLMVQKTNDLASRLSLTRGFEAMGRLESALGRCVAAAKGKPEADRIAQSCFQAMAQAAMVLALESPHIAEASDEGMNRIEDRMRAAVEAGRQALEQARGAGGDQAALTEALQAFVGLEEVNAEVVRLSRINSDVKSLALSLQKRRTAAAACEDALAALQELVDSRLSKATR